MKKILLLLICGLQALGLAAAGRSAIIVTESGETIKAFNVEVGPSAVYYQTSDDNSAPFERIAGTDVMVVKFDDGEKWMPGSNAAPDATATSSVTASTKEKSYPDTEANRKALEAMDPGKISFIGKEDGKTAGSLLMLFKPTDDSVLADQNVEMHLRSVVKNTITRGGGLLGLVATSTTTNIVPAFVYSSPCVMLDITNRSNKTIYVDLGDTYFVNGGESIRYYVPTSHVNSSTSSTGGAVNIGFGVTLGGGGTNSNTTMTYAERVIAIPPGVTKSFDQGAFAKIGKIKETGLPYGYAGGYYDLSIPMPKDRMYINGEEIRDLSHLNFPAAKIMTKYAFDEAMSEPVLMQATFEPDTMIAAKHKSTLGQAAPQPDQYSSGLEDLVYIFFRQIKK